MSLPEKSVKDFIKEMREAMEKECSGSSRSMEFKAVSNEGLVIKSKGWDLLPEKLTNEA